MGIGTPVERALMARAIVGAVIGANRSMGGGGGFFLGLILGPLGLLVVLLSGKPSTLQQIQARHEVDPARRPGAGRPAHPVWRTRSKDVRPSG